MCAADFVALGDSTRGTGDSEPDMVPNAKILIECADIVFHALFFNTRRHVICIDSDMCKCAMFAWFERQAVKKVVFEGATLSDASIKAITGFSSANFVHTTTLGVWLVVVPWTTCCESHMKLLIFSYSACYLCKKAAKFVASLNHYQMQLVRALGLHQTRAVRWIKPGPE